jgi:starch synthase
MAFGADEETHWVKWLPKSWQKYRRRRTVTGVPSAKLWTKPWLEIKALLQIRKGRPAQEVFHLRNQKFQEQIPESLIAGADCIIGFDTSSWILQQRCRRLGKPFILDASIAHPLAQQHIFEGLRSRFPLWGAQLPQKDPAYIQIEEKEMATADRIVVASAYTKHTYSMYTAWKSKISVNHYGIHLQQFYPKKAKGDHQNIIHFLFFGALTARKGFPWLCEVWERFHASYPNSRLIAAGYGQLPGGFRLPPGIECTGFIHPNDRLALFHRADVFVFPSYFEGFAQVIIEAMACGLPVITTTHTVGPEIISNGVEGFCIGPGADESLYQSMEHFMLHPDQIGPMGEKAATRVSSMTWEAYGDRWGEIIGNVIAEDKRSVAG